MNLALHSRHLRLRRLGFVVQSVQQMLENVFDLVFQVTKLSCERLEDMTVDKSDGINTTSLKR